MASFPGGSSISLIFCSFRLSSLCFCHLSEVGRPVPRGFRPPDEELALQQPRCAIRGSHHLTLIPFHDDKRPVLATSHIRSKSGRNRQAGNLNATSLIPIRIL
jgi:hypothetical protein